MSYDDEIMVGSERADQLWHFAEGSANAELIMRGHLDNAKTRQRHLFRQLWTVIEEVEGLKKIMHENGLDE